MFIFPCNECKYKINKNSNFTYTYVPRELWFYKKPKKDICSYINYYIPITKGIFCLYYQEKENNE